MFSFKPFLRSLMLCMLLIPAFAYADQTSIPGEDDPAYLSAVETWLNGDDLPALQALSDLSHAGNTAAQILLGRIADDVSYHIHVTGPMNRQDRIALLKMPGGLSGKSWLNTAAENTPFAVALLNSARIRERLSAMPYLFQSGENVIATRAAWVVTYNGEYAEVLEILNQVDNLPDEAMPVWLELYPAANNIPTHERPLGFSYSGVPPSEDLIARSEATPEFVFLQDSFPYTREFIAGDQKRLEEVKAVALAVPHWTPFAQFCSRHCPEDINECTAVAGAASAFMGPQFPMSSPTERLIPNEIYWQSARIDGDITRRLRDPAPLSLLAKVDSCFTPAIERLHAEMGLTE